MLAPWKKSYDQSRQYIKKQRYYFANKSLSSQSYGISSSQYGCESWTIKKAECWRIDAFELWCWRRLLRIHWTARRSNQSVVKEISPEYSPKGLMLKLKLQYFCHLMRRTDSLEKTLMLGKIEGRRRWEWQRMRWLDDITDSRDRGWVSSGSSWWTGKPGVLQSMGLQRVGHDWAAELNWKESRGQSLLEVFGNMVTHSSTLGKFHGWRSLVGYTVHGVAKSQTWLSDFIFFHLVTWEIPSLPLPNCSNKSANVPIIT